MKLTKEIARKIYPESPGWFKEELEAAFGKECFKKKCFFDIKTFEDACEELDLNANDFITANCLPDEIAYKKLKVIIMAVNQGWIPDWNNDNQRKWWPYFNLSSGFGFSCSYYGYDDTSTAVGSRLCFETEEKSNYVAKQFLDLYKEFLTIIN